MKVRATILKIYFIENKNNEKGNIIIHEYISLLKTTCSPTDIYSYFIIEHRSEA